MKKQKGIDYELVFEMFRENVLKSPEKAAVVFTKDDSGYTYAELDEVSRSLCLLILMMIKKSIFLSGITADRSAPWNGWRSIGEMRIWKNWILKQMN